MILTAISDVLPQFRHEQGEYGNRYYAAAPDYCETGSSLMIIDHGQRQYTLDLWSDEGSMTYWENRIQPILESLEWDALYATFPVSFPWEKLGFRVDVLAHRHRFIGKLKDIPASDIPDDAATWISAQGQAEGVAQILLESDPSCPGLEAARQAVKDIYRGAYGTLLKGSGLVELEGQQMGACLLNDEFGSVLIAHICTLPNAKRKGWARWLAAYGLQRCITEQYETVKASLDANNIGSYRLMASLNLQQIPEPAHVCRITKERDCS
ncbi:GNAT family N-acetyltransferase [Paenibacillus sp. OK003]|uniref:GNAT family N-acetyltransferase n=1 Tax=Paenibacillus sp. OK003 TaxID=1884380 RepID=UPI0008C00761|nr:GNAT family N-acetyltransferase [Paenibacillus sp. OK003]SEL19298.1 FR47-like protein [Paenibacillus sp. OK003]